MLSLLFWSIVYAYMGLTMIRPSQSSQISTYYLRALYYHYSTVVLSTQTIALQLWCCVENFLLLSPRFCFLVLFLFTKALVEDFSRRPLGLEQKVQHRLTVKKEEPTVHATATATATAHTACATSTTRTTLATRATHLPTLPDQPAYDQNKTIDAFHPTTSHRNELHLAHQKNVLEIQPTVLTKDSQSPTVPLESPLEKEALDSNILSLHSHSIIDSYSPMDLSSSDDTADSITTHEDFFDTTVSHSENEISVAIKSSEEFIATSALPTIVSEVPATRVLPKPVKPLDLQLPAIPQDYMPPTPHSHTENDTFFSSRKSIRSFHSGKSGRSIKNSIKSTMQKATRNFTPASSLSESSKRSSLGFNTSKFTKKEKRPRAYSYTSFANAHFPNNNVHVEPLPLPVALPVTSIHAVTSASSSSKSTQRNSFGHTFSKLLKKEGSNRAKVPPFADLVLPPPVPQTSVDYFSPQPKTEMPSPLKTYTPESFKADAPESLKADTTGSTKKKFGSRLKKLFTKK